jgi:hypothetical protein
MSENEDDNLEDQDGGDPEGSNYEDRLGKCSIFLNQTD